VQHVPSKFVAGAGMGPHSFLACSRARAWPKWNRSKMPAHSRRFAQLRYRPVVQTNQGSGVPVPPASRTAPSAYILTGLPSGVPAVLEGPSSDRAVQPAMVSSASARTSRASAGIVGGRCCDLSSSAGGVQRLLRALTILKTCSHSANERLPVGSNQARLRWQP